MDQFYFEEGYLEASYFTVIREAEAALPVAMTFSAQGDIADATGYYIPDYIVTDYFVSGQQIEADATLSVTATQTLIVERITQSAATINVSATNACTVTRITQAEATVNVSATNACTVTRIRDSAAAFTAAFAPTLTATAFKNHTAVLDSVSTMSVDAQANRSANVLLEHIADLNAMAAKTVDVNSNLSHTVSAVITANTNSSAQFTATSTFTLTCAFENLQFATAAFTASTNLFVSRYTNGRPRQLSGIDYQYLNEYFTTDSKFGSHALQATAPTTTISATGSSAYSIIPQANQDWIFECWYYQVSGHLTHTVVGFFVGGGSRFFALESEDTGRFTLRTFKTGGINTTTTTSISFSPGWLHLAVLYKTGQCQLFVNGARYINQNLSAYTNVAWTGNSIEAQDLVYRLGVRGNVRLDEASFHRGSTLGYSLGTTITVPTERRENDPAYTQFLYHFDNNGFDDIALTQTGTANLSAVSAITAQANANTKLGAASLSTAATLTAQGDRPASATANLSTTSTLSVIIGSVKDSITLNAGVFSVIAQESRLRDVSCSVTSAFTPTLNAVATRGGDIALSSAFALTADANSFTNSNADIAAVFSISATADGITRLGASALSSEFNQATVIGKLQSVSVPITSAFTTVMNVAYFEGTSLIAPMAAVMSVTAVKTARITKTLSAVTSVTADVFVAEFADYTVITPITDRGLIHFNTATAVDEFGGTISPNTGYTSVTGKFGNGLGSPSSSRTLTNGSTYANLYNQSVWTVDFWYKPNDLTTSSFVMPISGILALSNVAQSGTYQANGGDQNIMLGWRQNSLVSANQANGYFYFGYHWSDPNSSNLTTYTYSSGVATTYKHVAMVYEYLGSNNVRTTFYIDGVQQGVTTKNYGAYNPTTSSLVITPTTFRVTDRDTQGSFTKSYSGQLDELRFLPFKVYTANFTPETQEYNPPIQIVDNYKVAYAILDSRSTLSSSGISVVNIQAELFAGTFTQTAIIGSIRSTSSNQSSVFATAINAGKNVEIGSALASQSTISVNAVKATTTSADLNVAAAQSTANDRIRTTTAAVATTITVSVDAVKTTGVVVNAESAVSQSVTGFRIQQGQASISAFNSQLTAAFKNATGTVLLETVTAMQITAEKNAVGVIALASQFTQSTDSADSKTVRVSSAIAAEFTQTAEGLRIQPASADLTAQFTQSTNTDQSKTTRITADFSVSVSQTIQAERRRDGIALQASLGTLSCSIDRLRRANSNLSAVIYDFTASPQYIIRITATFSAFNSQLTVGEIINIDPALQLMIEPETRIRKIPQETRVLSIESETRVNIIED